MRKLVPTLAFIFLFGGAVLAQTPTPTPKPVEDDGEVVKISTTLVQIDVTVTDKNGKIITDLKPEEIEIFENGEKQEISNFSFISNVKTAESPAPNKTEKKDKNAVPLPPNQLRPEQIKRTVALVVDDLSLSFQSTYYVQRSLKKFVNEQMQDGDLVAIIRTGAGIGALQQFTSDKRQLLAAIEKVRWNPVGTGNVGAFAPIQSSSGDTPNYSGSDDEEDGGDGGAAEFNSFRESVFATGTLGAVNFIIRGMKNLPGRKSVMLFSDGFKIFSRSADGFSDSTRVLDSLRRLVDLANRASVVVYTMDARGLQTLGLTAEDDTSGLSADRVEQKLSDRRTEFFDSQEGLIYLAKQTGGLSIINNNDLTKGIERMLDDQSYYLIGYQPDAETFDPAKRRFNKFTVKVKRAGARVRYRSGFFGVGDDQIKPPTTLTAAQQIQTALTSPFAVNDVSLRLNTLFGNGKQGSFVRSLLHVNAKDLKFTDEPDGSKKAVFDILAVSFGDNGTAADQIAKTYTLKVRDEAYQKVIKEGFVYYFTFPVKKPGAYQYRVAIRDTATQKVGSANQFIEVPNLKKNRLTTSGITLENLTAEQWQRTSETSVAATVSTETKAQNSTDPMTDTSLRRFKRGTILRYAFEVYNAKLDAAQKPNLTAQIKVFRDGKLILDGKTTPLDLLGQTDWLRIKSVGALSLGSEMTAGEYVLQVIITDHLAKEKRRLTTQFVQFEIQ
ncbi:MAG: VWA domain-containing protein [Pyrinomonadaceae bacterium]|nr:VWA domain-containing protein [Pyrinomonadaceae bacterium]